MGVFRYQAVDSLEAIVRGTITADSIQQARRELRERGLAIRRISEFRSRRRFATFLVGPWRTGREWPQAVDEMAMLLQAGIPLLEALDTLADQARGSFRTTLCCVRDRVAGGASLAEAMRTFPAVFDQVSVQLVEVGENTGELEVVLEELAAYQQHVSQFKDQVVTILIYPVFLLVLGASAAIFLMTHVMPPLFESLTESVPQLPWPTRVVQAASTTLVSYGWILMLVAALVFGVSAGLLQLDAIRQRIHRWWLRVPLLGSLALKQNIARAATVIAVLARSGTSLTQALELAASTSKNLAIRAALFKCCESVMTGQTVSKSLADLPIFPPVVVRIFTVAEESGKLEELLSKLAADYTRQVAQRSARIAAILEPAMIIVLSFFIGFLMLAIILPILEAGNVV